MEKTEFRHLYTLLNRNISAFATPDRQKTEHNKAKVYGVRECHEDGMEPGHCIIEFDRHGIALDDVPCGIEDKAFKSAKKAEKHIRAMGGIIAGDYFDLCERLILPDYMDRRIPLIDIMDTTDETEECPTGRPAMEQADKPKGTNRKQG